MRAGALHFRTTAEVEPLAGTIGQPRAVEALSFGLEIETLGYNLFVAGAPGSGRSSAVGDELERISHARPIPGDWIYVHDFTNARTPNAIRVRAGRGTELARAMEDLVANARRVLPRVFESEEYDRRQRELMNELNEHREALANELRRFAAERSFAIDLTPVGVARAPLLQGKRLAREQFEGLPQESQAAIGRASSEVEERAATFLHRVRELEKATLQRAAEIEREVALFALDPRLQELREQFADEPEVLAYLRDVEADMLSSIDELRREPAQPTVLAVVSQPDLTRYSVNVVVDNSSATGAPIVLERNPTVYSLFGRIDFRSTFGSMVTDFRQIRAGAVHKANGGYLVLYAADVLVSPFAWAALKRALTSREIRIENLGEHLSIVPTIGLQPEPISLDLKVILIGTNRLYQLLHELDEEFRELFKVKAHFTPDMPWSEEHAARYASAISRWVHDADLRHFDRSGVARVIEHGARLAQSQTKLTTRMRELADVVAEASHWAGKVGRETVNADDVGRALERREYRANALEERQLELIADGTLAIDVDGWYVGRVNGLSLIQLGDHDFGRPVRVSARVGLGRGSVQSIEREIELSGPIHSKGFLILSGYLKGSYGEDKPLALAATLTFEQSYDEVEGDSASSTELYALLSALADVPLDQAIAVTGSVDQHGDVQAVGAVTRKIEGYFAACKTKGLTGRQGVIIPATNTGDLMLSDEVVRAAREARFHVWAIQTVDEGLELLTGLPAAELHARVDARLARFAELARDQDAALPAVTDK